MQKWETKSEENSDSRGFQVIPPSNTVQLLLSGGHRALLIVDPSSDRVASSHPILQRNILHALTSDNTAPEKTRRTITCISSEHFLSSEGGPSTPARSHGSVDNRWSAAGAGERSSLILYTKDQHNQKGCQPHCSLLAACLSETQAVNGVHTPAGLMIVPHPPLNDVTTSDTIHLLPSITELQTVPESTPLPGSLPPQNTCSPPLPSEAASQGVGGRNKRDVVSEAGEELEKQDASGDSSTTTVIDQSEKTGLVSPGFNLTQSLQPLCEGREKLMEESDEEIDMSATDDSLSTSYCPHLRKPPVSVVMDSNLQTLSPPSHAIPHIVPPTVSPHIVPPTVSIEPEPRETPPQKRVRLCSDASQDKCMELKRNMRGREKDDGLLSTEAADDGSSTEDQTVPRECAREHGLVPSPASCNQHWPQGGGGEGGAGGELEVRKEGYWGDGDEESLWLCPVRSGEMSYQQISLEQQVVPDEPKATKQTVSSLYDQQDEGSYLDRTKARYQRRFSPHCSTHTAHTCCGCNTRVSEFPSTVPLNLSRPRLRLGLSKCQLLQPLHSRYSTTSSREE